MFVSRLVEDEVSEAQLGAWLMATYVHGLSVQVGEEPRNITSDTGQHSGDGVPHPGHGRQRREPGVARLLPQPRGGQAQHRRGRGQGAASSNMNLTLSTVGVIKICSFVFRELLSLGCINLENLCAHHREDLLTIPKHPQLAKFG